MVRLTVVHGDLLARRDRAQRIELDAALADAKPRIRLATVVRVAHGVRGLREVDRFALRDLDDHDPLVPRRADAGVGHADRLAADLADLEPLGFTCRGDRETGRDGVQHKPTSV